MGNIQEWCREIQGLITNINFQSERNWGSVLDVWYGNLLHILWNADASLYRCPRAHSQQQPSWWKDKCFDVLIARNAAWRQRSRAVPHGCPQHFVSIVLFALPKRCISPTGYTVLNTCNACVHALRLLLCGAVSATTSAVLHRTCPQAHIQLCMRKPLVSTIGARTSAMPHPCMLTPLMRGTAMQECAMSRGAHP